MKRKNSLIVAAAVMALCVSTAGASDGTLTPLEEPAKTTETVSLGELSQTAVQESAAETPGAETAALGELAQAAVQESTAELPELTETETSDGGAGAAEVPADGVYTAEFRTDSSMFHINEACEGRGTLTVENGRMTIHVPLVSKNILHLFPGTAEDAQKEGAVLLDPVEEEVTYSDGTAEAVYAFDIPVPAIGSEFDLALVGTKGTWYDHKVEVTDPLPAETAADAEAVTGAESTAEAAFVTEVESVAEMPSGDAAQAVADLIDAIYVQEWTEDTDAQCAAAKAAWDALTDEEKEQVEGEYADPDYFGRDTGDASADDPLCGDEIGEKEILVVSFGTSFNDSRTEDIGGVEKAIAAAFPDYSVRRAFTAQIIINHVLARDGEKIDNVEQALERAAGNGVKELVIQPTHLMHGAEYDELCAAAEKYADQFESLVIAEPLLGEVGADAAESNDDKKTVAEAVTAEAVSEAGYAGIEEAAEDGTAIVLIGHGTSHTAKVSYSQMQAQMDELGYENVIIGTVEGEPEDTSCESVLGKVEAAGFRKIVLRPLMVVAGDHANNDMAGDDADSWKSVFENSGAFEEVECQIAGMGRIPAIEELYVQHTADAVG